MSTTKTGDIESKRQTSPVQNDDIDQNSIPEAKPITTNNTSNLESVIEKPKFTEPDPKSEPNNETFTSKQDILTSNNSSEPNSTEPLIKSESSSEKPINSVEPNSKGPIIELEAIVKEEPPTENLSTFPSEISKGNSDVKSLINENGNKEKNHKVPNVGNSPESARSEKLKNPKPTYPDGILKTSARIKEGVNNSKYDPKVLPITNDPKKIRAQVEFYFGDANLPTDKYMWSLTEGSMNKPVPIKKICEFGRMRRFSPYSAIVSALKESQFLKVSGEEGEELVEREVPFDPSAPRNTYLSRSIYAKGFGDEEPSSQFDIEAFFASYGPTNAVRLRRTPEKLFKGSVFVEFVDEETANKFLNLTSKPLWKGEHVLKIMSKKAYMDLKAEEIRCGNLDPHDNWSRGRGRGRGRGNSRGNRGSRGNQSCWNGRQTGDRDPDDWKKRREDDRASGFKNGRNQNHGKKGREKGRGRGDNRGRNNKSHSSDNHTETDKCEGDIKPKSVDVKHEPIDDKSDESTNIINKHDEKSTFEEGNNARADLISDFKQENENSKKRLREDDEELEKGPNKKLDTKADVSVEG